MTSTLVIALLSPFALASDPGADCTNSVAAAEWSRTRPAPGPGDSTPALSRLAPMLEAWSCGASFYEQSGPAFGPRASGGLRLSAAPRLERQDDAEDRFELGRFALSVAMESGEGHFPSVAVVAGVDRRTVFYRPGGLQGGDHAVSYSAATIDVADGFGGLALRLTPNRFVSMSYVRQERSFSAGEQTWDENDDYLGLVMRQSW